MRRTVSLLLSFVIIFALTVCGQSVASEKREETQPVVQKTEEQTETFHNVAEAEKQEAEKQMDMETELSESVSTQQQEVDVNTKTLVVIFRVLELLNLWRSI